MIKAIVLGIGEELSQIVNDYAFKTNRSAVLVKSASEIGDVHPEVIIVLTHNLTFEVIDHFYGIAQDRSVVGFITGNNLDNLALFAERVAIAFQSNGSRQFQNYAWLDLISKKNYHSLKHQYGQDYDSEVESVLTSKLDLLSILTHSDGVDAYLHKKLTLCPLMDIGESDADQLPACLINDECIRHRMPREVANDRGLLFDPRNIGAATLLLATCHGLLPPKSTVSPKWGLLDKLIACRNIHTIVTSEGACILDHSEFLMMHDTLLRGSTIGEAIKEFNCSEKSLNRSLRFILFGDPRLSLNCSGNLEKRIPQSPFYIPVRFYESLAFIRAYLTSALPGCTEALLPYIDEASSSLANLEYAAWTGKLDEANFDRMVHEASFSLIKFVGKRGQTISIDWLSLSDHQAFKEHSTCPKCNTKTTLTVCRMRLNPSLFRIIERCPVCSIIKDIPAHWDVTTDLSSFPIIRFTAEVFALSVCGLLIAGTDDNQNQLFLVDPGSSSDVLVDLATINYLPQGPLRISLLVSCGLEFGIITLAIHSHDIQDKRG